MGKKSAPAEEFTVDTTGEKVHKKKKSKKNQGDAVELNGKVEAEQESQNAGVEVKVSKKKKKKQQDLVEENAVVVEEVVTKSHKKKKRKIDDATVERCINEAAANEDSSPKKSKNNQNTVAENGTTEELEIVVSGRDSTNPKFKSLKSFSGAKVPENVLKCCSKFQKPSPIQAHSWPFLLDGRNLIGIAKTGSGKTLAFGVPAIMHVLKKKINRTTQCLVLSPTRELAQQIATVLEEAGADSGVTVACLYGGAPKGPQKGALRNGPAIVVATPGRLQDLINEGVCNLEHVTYLVLDEADRMLDLGFEPAVRSIVSHVSQKRQTIMFSATWPAVVEQLAQEFIQDSDPVKITIGSQDLTANHDVSQIVEVIDDRARDARLNSLLQLYHSSRKNRVLVFVLYKKEAARVEQQLQKRGWMAKAIHGDKSQKDRDEALAAFKNGSHPLLIATDVAARGLDIPDVEYVINYSFPLTTEDYVHRIGRTGRAGKKGIAHTFFTTFDKARAGELVNILREAGQTVPDDLLKFGTHVKKKESALYGAHFKEIAADAPKAKKIKFDSDDE